MVGEVEIPSPPHLVKSRPHLQAASTRILIFYKPHIVLHESVFRTLETSESAHRNRSFLKRNHFKASFTRTSTFYNSASQKILKVSEATAERRSLEVDLFRLNGFESYYKFTREKMIDICCVGSGVKLITHCPIGQLSLRHRQNFPPANFTPNGYEKSFKMA